MTPQQAEFIRDVPPEVPAQLRMNLELLAAAGVLYEALSDEHRARIEAMSDREAHEQIVAFLALLPPAIRDRALRCNTWLAQFMDDVSRPQVDSGRPAPAAQPSPAEGSLRLASSPESEATG